MDFFSQLGVWHWLIIAMLLLGAEALGAGGFLIGAAFAAIIMTVLSLAVDVLSWQLQITLFAVMALVFSIIYSQRFRKFNATTDQPQLNNRAARMHGTHLVLDEHWTGKQGTQQIGDTRWRLQANSHIASGTQVVVTGSDNMTLFIDAVTSSHS